MKYLGPRQAATQGALDGILERHPAKRLGPEQRWNGAVSRFQFRTHNPSTHWTGCVSRLPAGSRKPPPATSQLEPLATPTIFSERLDL